MRKILFITLILAGFLAVPSSQAALTCPVPPDKLPEGVTTSDVEKRFINVAVAIPGVTFTCLDDRGTPQDTSDDVERDYIQDVGAYIAGLYKFFAGAIGILASVMVFYGGLRWLTAAGNPSYVKDAKETIFSALIAVVISLGSYLLLYTINPNLVNLRPPSLQVLKGIPQTFSKSCPTTKTCQSGPRIGTACLADADCGGGGGICDFSVISVGSFQPTTSPVCGVEFKYKQGGDICFGAICPFLPSEGLKVCASNSVPQTTPQFNGDGVCLLAKDQCERLTDNVRGLESGNQDSVCRQWTQAGVGRCSWYDVGVLKTDEPNDRCAWYPVLICGAGWERAGCGECGAANVSCPDVDGITYEGEYSGGFDTDARCISSAGETVYVADQTGDGQTLKAICCRKTGFTDLKCVSNSTPPPDL